MSFVEKRNEFRPQEGEAPFALQEVFFSRTDMRGVIRAANYIFRRVANFEWGELLGAPHKTIRHPDMPKAVFQLLWNTIKADQPMGAYVKNLAKDGLHYWVYAVVVPLKDGYLSVRIKPSSDMLKTIETEYQALRLAEENDGVSPEESAAALQSRIVELDFADYSAFSNYTLAAELIARDEGLGNPADRSIAGYKKMLEIAEELQAETEKLTQEFIAMENIPNNMRVIASRLEPSGGAISALSQNYGEMSHEISNWFQNHVIGPKSNFAAIRSTINDSMFMECTARILTESANNFSGERRKLGDCDVDTEKTLLNNLAAEYNKKAASRLGRIADDAERISNASNKLQRYILGLNTTRVMCKIEGARLTKGRESLTDIIEQLGVFQSTIQGRLERINDISCKIQSYALSQDAM